MKWIELIVVRATDNQHKPAVKRLVNQFTQKKDPKGITAATLYRNAFVESDLGIHIQWEVDAVEPSKSDQGIKLAAALEGFGRIHHTIWVADEKS
jgi:hypothetical protein